MKTIITILLILIAIANHTDSQAQTWESLYSTYNINDPFFKQDIFQVPIYNSKGELKSHQRHWNQLNPKARRIAKQHLKTFYNVHPSKGGYIIGTTQTVGRSVARTAVYVVTMSAAAIVTGKIINQQP